MGQSGVPLGLRSHQLEPVSRPIREQAQCHSGVTGWLCRVRAPPQPSRMLGAAGTSMRSALPHKAGVCFFGSTRARLQPRLTAIGGPGESGGEPGSLSNSWDSLGSRTSPKAGGRAGFPTGPRPLR